MYLVEHQNTGDQLALKVLYGAAARDPMSLERFKREARASAKIRSDNVVKIVDADSAPELEGAPYLVMELLNGQDVEQLVEERGALPANEVIELLSQVARALDKAHAIGIIHRDLKPENLYLHRREDGSRMLKVLDFGIAKTIGQATGNIESAGMTGTGALIGTPLFMAPEQVNGLSSSISPATDVWAVGLIAFRMLTGDVYWSAETLGNLLMQIMVSEMAAPSSRSRLVSTTFDEWFFHSCQRDAAARFSSVGEQIAALAVALGVDTPQGRTSEAASVISARLQPLTPSIGSTSVTLAQATATTGATRSRVPLRVLGVVAVLLMGGALFFASKRAPAADPGKPATIATGVASGATATGSLLAPTEGIPPSLSAQPPAPPCLCPRGAG